MSGAVRSLVSGTRLLSLPALLLPAPAAAAAAAPINRPCADPQVDALPLAGLMYMLALVFGPLLQRFARQRVYLQAFGMVVAVAGLVGSAFATKPAHLVVTLGILYPFSCLLYLPCATLLFEWFSERRGACS